MVQHPTPQFHSHRLQPQRVRVVFLPDPLWVSRTPAVLSLYFDGAAVPGNFQFQAKAS